MGQPIPRPQCRIGRWAKWRSGAGGPGRGAGRFRQPFCVSSFPFLPVHRRPGFAQISSQTLGIDPRGTRCRAECKELSVFLDEAHAAADFDEPGIEARGVELVSFAPVKTPE